GFDPFTFDITDCLTKGSQKITVKVWDPTDQGPQPRGKQVRKPGGIWYTPVTGIWQTVWLEAVPENYIVSTTQTSDIHQQILKFNASVKYAKEGDKVRISAWDGQNKVTELEVTPDEEAISKIENQKL